MFRSGQILSAITLMRCYRKVARELESQPQAILITHRHGSHFVLVNAEIFEDLVNQQFGAQGQPPAPPPLKDVIAMPI